MPPRMEDLTGQRFGMLTVLREAERSALVLPL